MLKLVVIFVVSISVGRAIDIGDVDPVKLLRDEDPQDFDKEIVQWTLMTTPGTLWCGEDRKTDNDNELGEFKWTDSCCRDRFINCKLIEDGETKYGLENKNPFSVAECSCDKDFLLCLQDIDEDIRPEVEFKFFGIQHPPCFRFTDDKKETAEWSKPIRDEWLADEIENGEITLDLDKIK